MAIHYHYSKRRNPSKPQICTGPEPMKFKQKNLIESVPRFILIDPNRKIVEINLPKPQVPEMEKITNDAIQKEKEQRILPPVIDAYILTNFFSAIYLELNDKRIG